MGWFERIRASVESGFTGSREAAPRTGRDTSVVGMRVLVVDDHPGFRHQVRLMLEEAGYDVVAEVDDAAGAIRVAQQLGPEVVLLDVGLPDHDGFFVAEVLARGAAPPKVVLISGRDVASYGIRVAACGARGFVAKADLSAEALRRVLDGKAVS